MKHTTGGHAATRRWPVAIGPVLLYTLMMIWFLPFTLDDAFISMRYADNWAAGAGLVFNPGERVEGFSNPLWVALLAAAAAAGAPLPWVAKGMGAIAGAVVIALVAVAARRGGGSPSPPYGAWLLAASGGFAYHAAAGLETALYALLALGLALTTRRSPSARRVLLTTLLAAAAAATRPEGVLLLVLALGVSLVPVRPARIAAALPAVLAVAVLVAARHAYFGAWLPNTYLAKPGAAGLAGLGAGLSYVGRGLIGEGHGFELVAVLALLWLRPRCRQPSFGLIAVAAAGLAFALWSGGDWIAGGRYLIPSLAPMAILATTALAELGARRGRSLAVAVAVVITGARLLLTLAFAADLRHGGVYDHAHVSTANVAIGRWLAANSAPGASVLTDEIGAIGFHSRRTILDPWGLIDREVAQLNHELGFNPYAGAEAPGLRHEAQRQVAELLVARAPDYVLVDYRGPPDRPVQSAAVNPVTMRELLAAIEARGYRYDRRFDVDPLDPKSFLLYRRAATGP